MRDGVTSTATIPADRHPLALAAAAGRIQSGDVLLFKPAKPTLLQRGIAFAQRRALNDYYGKQPARLRPTPAQVADAAAYTHAAQAYNERCFAEQTSPHCRHTDYTAVPAGTIVQVRRPLPLWANSAPAWREQPYASRLIQVMRHWDVVVSLKEPYPAKELLYYWFRWCSKLALRRKFAQVFRAKHQNVCSGEVVEALQAGGWFYGENPDAWYPARLADTARLVTVETIEV